MLRIRTKVNHAKTPRCNVSPRPLGFCAIAALQVARLDSEFCCRYKSLSINDL